MSPPRQLAGKSLDEIADFMAGVTQGSLNDQMAIEKGLDTAGHRDPNCGGSRGL